MPHFRQSLGCNAITKFYQIWYTYRKTLSFYAYNFQVDRQGVSIRFFVFEINLITFEQECTYSVFSGHQFKLYEQISGDSNENTQTCIQINTIENALWKMEANSSCSPFY